METVFRQHGPRVRSYLLAAGASEADDLLSDVFVSITRNLPKFRGTDDELRAWIFSIARNRLRDEFRRRQRRDRRQPASGSTPDVASDVAAAPESLLDPGLVTALRSLTEEQREVVVLRFVADLSLEDVARMTGRSAGAVKSLQHRALASLGRLLDETSSP